MLLLSSKYIIIHIILKMSFMHFSNATCMMILDNLPKDLCNSKSLFDFYNILGQSDCNVIRKISKSIFYMLKKRNSITIW